MFSNSLEDHCAIKHARLHVSSVNILNHPGKKKKGKGSKKTKPYTATRQRIQCYFTNIQEAPPEAKMGDLDTLHHMERQSRDPTTSPVASMESEAFLDTPGVFHSDSQGKQHQALTLRADAKLGTLLQALPKRSDIKALISRLEATHRKELAEVRTDIKSITTYLSTGEALVASLERRMLEVEAHQTAQAASMMTMQLQLEELEDRS